MMKRIDMHLECTNEDGCKSETFTINLIVGNKGEMAEATYKIPGECFECCECHDEAEWVDDDTNPQADWVNGMEPQ